MVPATMCRTAMVAVLCAVAACFAVLMTTSPARADEPVPLGQVEPSSEAQPDVAADSGDPSSDWSGEGWSGHDWAADGAPWSEASACDLLAALLADDATWDEWFENACADDWAWKDWWSGSAGRRAAGRGSAA